MFRPKRRNKAMTTFVLIGGFWIRAWAWREVAAKLTAAGHLVFPLSLTGLGERKAQATPGVGLETHVSDVVHFIISGDLHDVVLVGHSGAGAIITIVADRIPERLAGLVYVDSGPVPDGACIADFSGPTGRADTIRKAAYQGDGWRISLPLVGTRRTYAYRSRYGEARILPGECGRSTAARRHRSGSTEGQATRRDTVPGDPLHHPGRGRAWHDRIRQSVVCTDGWAGMDTVRIANRPLADAIGAREARRDAGGLADRHSRGRNGVTLRDPGVRFVGWAKLLGFAHVCPVEVTRGHGPTAPLPTL
jgi:pimeloyl-ACP methyl ester carboxylesterase